MRFQITTYDLTEYTVLITESVIRKDTFKYRIMRRVALSLHHPVKHADGFPTVEDAYTEAMQALFPVIQKHNTKG